MKDVRLTPGKRVRLSPRRPKVYHSDSGILGGTVVFVGTRVPVRSLFDYLERDRSLDYFLECFPSVKRAQCVAVLEEAKNHASRREAALARSA